jgi:2-alkyl-3-oxoalkanoate reductase
MRAATKSQLPPKPAPAYDPPETEHQNVGVSPMQQSVLVLGANGFIGKEVVAALAATGWATPILGVRRPSGNAKGFEQRGVDATNTESVATAIKGVSAVVDCVAGDPVATAKAVFGAAGRVDPQIRVVHLSTMSVYGSTVGLVDESAPLRGDVGPYSVAKIEAEQIAGAYPRTVVFRPGCVFGPGSTQWSVRFARLLLSRRMGDLGAAGDGSCNLVHVGDVAAAVVRAVERTDVDGQVFNLSTPDPPTWNDYLIRYAKALRAVPVRRIAGRRLRVETRLLAPPLKIAEILGSKLKMNARLLPPPIPPSLLRLMSQDIRLDTRRAQTVLGLQWRNLDAALQSTADWFIAAGGAR